MKLVSIVIPTFNNATVIAETINSICSQHYNEWEAIFVDDGSTDSTCEIINSFSRKDSRIKLIKRVTLPKGGSHCRNIGLATACGDYIIFLDGDDKLAPECLEKRISIIENSTYDFCLFPMAIFQYNQVFNKRMEDRFIKDYKSAFASVHSVWQVSQPIYKVDFVKALNGFDEGFLRLQDIEFGLRAVIHSKGNFKTFFELSPDSFYRLSNSIVTAQKYNLALSQYANFINLLLRLYIEGEFTSRVKFSRILLCLLMSANLVYLAPVKMGETPGVNISDIIGLVDFDKYICKRHKYLLKFLLLFYKTPKFQDKLLWFIRRTFIFCFF